MAGLRSFILAGALAAIAQAFTQPTAQTWGALLTPNLGSPVTQGQTYTVTWDPSGHATDGVTVSLVLCHGAGSNCVLAPSAIIEGVPAALKSYSWDVPCSLAPGTQQTDTGYGMLVIVDGTGEFQYSTQFSVLEGSSCSSSGSGSTTSGSPSSSTPTGPTSASSTPSGSSNTTAAAATTTPWDGSTSTAETIHDSSTGSGAAASTMNTVATTSFAVATHSNTASASSSTFSGAAERFSGHAIGAFGLAAAGVVAFL